jgi:hypothetical protein
MQQIALWLVFLIAGCGATYRSSSLGLATAAGGAGASAVGTPAAAEATLGLPEQLVVEGAVRLEVSEVKDLIAALRAQVEQLGGRIIEEEVSGLGAGWQGQVKLRVPPQHVETVVTWLAGHGDILDKRISASDVSKTLFDQELAIKNAELTLDRLEGILRQGGLTMQDVLAIEREMTRLRGEIESIKGQSQFLKDRVALATLEISMTRKSGAVHLARAKAYPGARVSSLVLLAPGGRARARLGGGFVLHALFRSATVEVDLYEAEDDANGSKPSMAVVATYGGAVYSDFLGGGERKFGNPYLGVRSGYGYLDSHRFVVQAEAGVELFKSRRFALDASARFTGFIGSKVDAAVILGSSAVVAF